MLMAGRTVHREESSRATTGCAWWLSSPSWRGGDFSRECGVGQAKLLRQVGLEPEVDFYGLCLQDADLAQVPVPYPGERVMEGFITAHQGRVDLESAGHTHTAVMRAEVWDGEPPPDTSRVWEEQGETQLHCVTGSLQVWGVSCGPILDEITLGVADRDWNVRVCCAGREEVARVVRDEGIAEGIETYLVQFWPR
jgi:hypothetical protein